MRTVKSKQIESAQLRMIRAVPMVFCWVACGFSDSLLNFSSEKTNFVLTHIFFIPHRANLPYIRLKFLCSFKGNLSFYSLERGGDFVIFLILTRRFSFFAHLINRRFQRKSPNSSDNRAIQIPFFHELDNRHIFICFSRFLNIFVTAM